MATHRLNKRLRLKDGFMDESSDNFEADEKCPTCGAIQFYSIRYDAYFCKKCNKWLETGCDDQECKFCLERPEKPLSKLSDISSTKPSLEKMNEKELKKLIGDLNDEETEVRKNAAHALEEAAGKGLDISAAITSLIVLLTKNKEGLVEDILYDYINKAPEDMGPDYEKYLDIYECYLALEHFAKTNVKFLLKEIEKAKINKNLLWVKNLIKYADMNKTIILKCDICKERAANIEFNQEGNKFEIKIETFLGFSTIYFSENDRNLVEEFIDKIGTEEGRKELFKKYGRWDPPSDWLNIANHTIEFAFLCSKCNKIYCKKEWTNVHERFDEGYYDETLATCPQGHEVCLDD